jgi:hypothetical protein
VFEIVASSGIPQLVPENLGVFAVVLGSWLQTCPVTQALKRKQHFSIGTPARLLPPLATTPPPLLLALLPLLPFPLPSFFPCNCGQAYQSESYPLFADPLRGSKHRHEQSLSGAGDFPTIEEMLAESPEKITEVDEHGRIVLLLAAQYGQLEL